MKINVSWDNDAKTILHYKFAAGWSWNDLREIFNEGYQMLSTVDHPVDVIMDFTEAAMFAPSGAIGQARHVANNPRHENIRLTILVGSSFVSSIFNMMSRIAGNLSGKWDVVFVNTLDEAYQKINDHQAKQDV
jgi:hypothetical protein